MKGIIQKAQVWDVLIAFLFRFSEYSIILGCYASRQVSADQRTDWEDKLSPGVYFRVDDLQINLDHFVRLHDVCLCEYYLCAINQSALPDKEQRNANVTKEQNPGNGRLDGGGNQGISAAIECPFTPLPSKRR